VFGAFPWNFQLRRLLQGILLYIPAYLWGDHTQGKEVGSLCYEGGKEGLFAPREPFLDFGLSYG
jgi:hypothetical protein